MVLYTLPSKDKVTKEPSGTASNSEEKQKEVEDIYTKLQEEPIVLNNFVLGLI